MNPFEAKVALLRGIAENVRLYGAPSTDILASRIELLCDAISAVQPCAEVRRKESGVAYILPLVTPERLTHGTKLYAYTEG